MKCRTEVFSRITGFFRPVQEWNPGKKEEHKDRHKYDKDIKCAPEKSSKE